jgi:hypothetical protein
MKTIIKLFIAFFGLPIIILSCNRPVCKNTNPIFDKYKPNTEEYKAELAKQLELVDRSKLSYWFWEYIDSTGQELLFFKITGDELCAIIVLNVDQWNKLEELRQKKGVTFRGAEFINLKFDIKHDSIKTEFIYRDFDRIID